MSQAAALCELERVYREQARDFREQYARAGEQRRAELLRQYEYRLTALAFALDVLTRTP